MALIHKYERSSDKQIKEYIDNINGLKIKLEKEILPFKEKKDGITKEKKEFQEKNEIYKKNNIKPKYWIGYLAGGIVSILVSLIIGYFLRNIFIIGYLINIFIIKLGISLYFGFKAGYAYIKYLNKKYPLPYEEDIKKLENNIRDIESSRGKIENRYWQIEHKLKEEIELIEVGNQGEEIVTNEIKKALSDKFILVNDTTIPNGN